MPCLYPVGTGQDAIMLLAETAFFHDPLEAASQEGTGHLLACRTPRSSTATTPSTSSVDRALIRWNCCHAFWLSPHHFALCFTSRMKVGGYPKRHRPRSLSRKSCLSLHAAQQRRHASSHCQASRDHTRTAKAIQSFTGPGQAQVMSKHKQRHPSNFLEKLKSEHLWSNGRLTPLFPFQSPLPLPGYVCSLAENAEHVDPCRFPALLGSVVHESDSAYLGHDSNVLFDPRVLDIRRKFGS
jgi:hypothetical protein